MVGVLNLDWWTVFSETHVREHDPGMVSSSTSRQHAWEWVTTLENGTTLQEIHLMASLWSPPVILYPTSHWNVPSKLDWWWMMMWPTTMGIVKCSTNITGLQRQSNYFVVYSDSVFNNYSELLIKFVLHMYSYSYGVLFIEGPMCSSLW